MAWPGWYPYPGIWFGGPYLSWGGGFGIGWFGGYGWGWGIGDSIGWRIRDVRRRPILLPQQHIL